MKSNNQFRLNAHALLSALIVSLVVIIILSSLLLLHYQSQWQWVKYEKNERLQRNLKSATNILLGDTANTNISSEELLDLFGQSTDSVRIEKYYWGAYNFASVKSFSDKRSVSKFFFYGTELNDTLSGCIYLVDHQRPLQITGNTKLIGDVYLPKAGIKPTYFDGKGYNADRLYFGDNFKSDTLTTFTDQKIVGHVYSLFKKCDDKLFLQLVSHHIPDSVINSFENEPQIYVVNKPGILNGNYLKGKIILVSDSLVRISSNTHLEDVVVIAPEIILADDFNGVVQLIASKTINIGKRCRLNYPSSILLLKDSINNYQGIVNIGDSSHVTGLLFANASPLDFYKNSIVLNNGTIFKGVVFVHGYVQPKGQIYGTVITDFFLYKSMSAIYENSLSDAVIDRTKLSVDFVISTLIKKPGRLKIMKWVN